MFYKKGGKDARFLQKFSISQKNLRKSYKFMTIHHLQTPQMGNCIGNIIKMKLIWKPTTSRTSKCKKAILVVE